MLRLMLELRANVSPQFIDRLEVFAHRSGKLVIDFGKLFGANSSHLSLVVDAAVCKLLGFVVCRILNRERSTIAGLNADEAFVEFFQNTISAQLNVEVLLLDFLGFGGLIFQTGNLPGQVERYQIP